MEEDDQEESLVSEQRVMGKKVRVGASAEREFMKTVFNF